MKFDKDGDRETLHCGHELKGTFGLLRPGNFGERCPTEVSPSVLMFHVEHSGETYRRMEQVTDSPSHPSGLDLNQLRGWLDQQSGRAAPMGVLTFRPSVPRGTPRRNSETDGANDPFARLSECPMWNIRRSRPLVANSFSGRHFTLLRMEPSARGRNASVLPR